LTSPTLHPSRTPAKSHALPPFQSHRIALACPYACAGNTVLRASYMHPTVNRIALVCPYTCACNAVLRAPPFKAPSKAHFLIPFKGLIPLIFIKNGWSIYRRRKLPYIFLSHFIPFYYHRQTHPFPTSLPSSQHQPRCVLSPSPPFLCMPPHACIAKQSKCHGGLNMPGVIHLTDYYKGN